MKFSTRSTYGMRAMLALAQTYGQGTIMVREIAERQHLPVTYLEQLMVPLRKAGLVSAVRGAHGGYTLTRPPMEITIGEIVTALEGPIDLAECPNAAGCCGQPDICALRDLWADAGQVLSRFFDGMTLATLVEQQRLKEANSAPMYTI